MLTSVLKNRTIKLRKNVYEIYTFKNLMHYIPFYFNYQRRNLGCISTEADPMNVEYYKNTLCAI